MADAGADLKFVSYPDTIHGFTVPAATARGERFDLPLRYSLQADSDSWIQLQNLLTETFEPERLQ